jgi:hypothetical protein
MSTIRGQLKPTFRVHQIYPTDWQLRKTILFGAALLRDLAKHKVGR